MADTDKGAAALDANYGEVLWLSKQAEIDAGLVLEPTPDAKPSQFVDGADFVASIQPPHWLVDGVIQRSYLYGLTAPTNHGKTALAAILAVSVAIGKPFATKECERGHVLYLAGENPEDFKLRLRGACQAMAVDMGEIAGNITVLPATGSLTDFILAIKEFSQHTPISLIIIDTAAAYFSYGDENANVDNRLHAQDMRMLIGCAGSPAVLALCHPVKNAAEENLLPRGGSAFVNELDANLTLFKRGDVAELSFNKLRGPPFQPIQFEMLVVALAGVTDSKGRQVSTAVVKHLTEHEAAMRDDQGYQDLRALMFAVQRSINRSQRTLANLARSCDWVLDNGVPYKVKAQRLVNQALAEKFLKREAGDLVLTGSGKRFLGV